MATLTRTVRFAINPLPPSGTPILSGTSDGGNGFGGRPVMQGLGRYYEVDVVCRGEPDPTTGYLINIKEIDRAVRAYVIPIIADACATKPMVEPGSLLPEMLASLARALSVSVTSMRWRLTPYYGVEMSAATKDRITIRQQFDFAAAHRLHVEALDDARNREVFGRCNNPNAHGHNYRIEPAVEVGLGVDGPSFSLVDLERVTMATIIERFDHKNLSKDCPEFTAPNGVNASVENIARVFYGILKAEIERASRGEALLKRITVWETDRTSCTYPE